MAPEDPLSQLDQAVLESVANDLFDDAHGKALVRNWSLKVLDPKTAAMIESRVHRYRVAKALSGCPFDRPRMQGGDLVLGTSWQNHLLQIPLQFLNGHSLDVAGSGGGKTVRTCFLAAQIAPQLPGLLIIDLRKREFRGLQHYLARRGVELIVLSGRSLQLNPLQAPPGVLPGAWASKVAGMLVQVLALPPRASTTVMDKTLALYRTVRNSGSLTPTLFDLYEEILRDDEVNPQAKAAILDALRPVLLSLGPVLAYHTGWPPEELARRRLCLELDDVGEVEKDLIINYILTSEFTRRVALGISNPRMDWLVFLDEAQRIASASRHSGGIADMLCVVRGTGIGVDLSVQSTHDLHPLVFSNTAIKWLGRVGSFTDASAIGAAMGLTAEQLRWAATNLRPGQWIAQVGEGSDRRPFFVQSPLLDLSTKHTTIVSGARHLLPAGEMADAEAKHGAAALDDLPVVPAPHWLNWDGTSSPRNSENDRSVSVVSLDVRTAAVERQSDLSQAETQYLNAVLAHPGRPSSDYPKLAGLGTHRAQSIRHRLVELGYLRERSMATGVRGRTAIVLEPTPKTQNVPGLSEAPNREGGEA